MSSRTHGNTTSEATDRILHDAIYRLIQGSLYPYQWNYIQDFSRLKASLWARGTGKSYTAGWECAILALEKKDDFLLTAGAENQAKELLRHTLRALEPIDKLTSVVTGESIFYKRPTAEQILLVNGSRIMVRPNNALTMAGYTANVFWDETAKTLNDEEMWRAAFPVLRATRSMRLMSSAWGARGLFWEIMTRQKFKSFSLHNTNIVQAIEQGLPADIDIIKMGTDEWMFDQEYMNLFIASTSSPFHQTLLEMCAKLVIEPAPRRGATGDDGSLQQFFVGVDLGRSNDKTAIVWATEYPAGFVQVVAAEKIGDMPLPQQEAYLERILRLPYVAALACDATGLGTQMADSLGMKFPGKFIPFNFNLQSKNQIVTNALFKMEKGLLKIDMGFGDGRQDVPLPDDPHDGAPNTRDPNRRGAGVSSDILNDLTMIQRTYSNSGNVLYGAQRNTNGHADGAWAFLLAVHALGESTSGSMMVDFGFDDYIVQTLKEEGSFDVSKIVASAAARERAAREREEKEMFNAGIARLTGNGVVGMFTEEELSRMSDIERDFYGYPPRKREKT